MNKYSCVHVHAASSQDMLHSSVNAQLSRSHLERTLIHGKQSWQASKKCQNSTLVTVWLNQDSRLYLVGEAELHGNLTNSARMCVPLSPRTLYRICGKVAVVSVAWIPRTLDCKRNHKRRRGCGLICVFWLALLHIAFRLTTTQATSPLGFRFFELTPPFPLWGRNPAPHPAGFRQPRFTKLHLVWGVEFKVCASPPKSSSALAADHSLLLPAVNFLDLGFGRLASSSMYYWTFRFWGSRAYGSHQERYAGLSGRDSKKPIQREGCVHDALCANLGTSDQSTI